jgi:hypothetical protein
MKVFNQTSKKGFSWFFIFLLLVHTTSCSFYQVEKLTRYDAFGIKNFRPADKKVIVHAGQETFMLSDFKLDSTYLTGNISEMDSSLYYYDKNNRYWRIKYEEKEITKEVHFYLKEGNIQPSYVEIPLSNVEEIHVISYSAETSVATTVAVIGGGVLIAWLLFYVTFILSYGA